MKEIFRRNGEYGEKNKLKSVTDLCFFFFKEACKVSST